LVTIYLTTESDEDRGLNEHLDDYLQGGWRVADFKPLNGSSSGGGGGAVSGWLVVLLERGTLG
jgi:hypothetical protein